MFKPTKRQISLWEPARQAAESVQRRLRGSWAQGFASKVLPLLLAAEDDFAHLYASDNGRPNWSVARMLGICLLQEAQDFDDQTALDCVAFDIRWQNALGLESSEAYLCRRSLVDFRSRLAARDPEMKLVRGLFERIGSAAIDDLKISTKEQRIDSTLVRSNIYTRGRIDLFRKTLLHFLDWLAQSHPAKHGRLGARVRAWHEKTQEGGWFGRIDKERRQQVLKDLAARIHVVVTLFAADKDVNGEEPYLILAHLFSEQREVKTSDQAGSGGAGGSDRWIGDRCHPISQAGVSHFVVSHFATRDSWMGRSGLRRT